MMNDAPEDRLKSCFPPVAGAGTRLLILGSLPGEQSLKLQRYYGHPRNQFWRLMELVIGAPLEPLPYEQRLHALQQAGVGLWDVIASAVRPGSLDQAIRTPTANPLADFVRGLPALRAIGFNGGTAARVGQRLLCDTTAVAMIPLPSSSPAYVLPFETKAAAWQALMPYLGPSHL